MARDSREKVLRVAALSDGVRTSTEIAEMLGIQPRNVRKIALRHELPRPSQGSQPGSRNHRYAGGRRIDLDGYVTNPPGRTLEHRAVMETRLGRELRAGEVVDHKDGLTLHNHPDNLRLFSSNGEHLRQTTAGQQHRISAEGLANMRLPFDQRTDLQPVDTYRRNRERGDVRLRAILRAALSLGIASPFLLGSHRWLEKAGIDWSRRHMLERALQALDRRWLQAPSP